jgi:hypothetical protein
MDSLSVDKNRASGIYNIEAAYNDQYIKVLSSMIIIILINIKIVIAENTEKC